MFDIDRTVRRAPALVLLTSNGGRSLFDTDLGRLKREVEGRLGFVYVLQADAAGGRPSLKDALSAARFVGCDSAVVVAVDAPTPSELRAVETTPSKIPIEAVVLGGSRDPDAVVQAYEGVHSEARLSA